MLEFDWYQATIRGVTSEVGVILSLLHGAGPLVMKPGGGGFNRPFSDRASLEDGGSLAVYYGDGQDVHVVGTSSAAPHVAAVLRAEYPDHTVSRADVAYDLDSSGAFEKCWKTAHMLARSRTTGRPLTTSTVGDWLDGVLGRTLYVGGPSSAVRVRVYEKGLEQRSKHPDREFSADWVRVEWQIRPQSSGKKRAATLGPAELAAWTPFGADLLASIAALELAPTAPARTPSTDPEYWMARQYSAILREWAVLPADECLARVVAALELAPSGPRTAPTPRGTEFVRSGAFERTRA